MTSEGRTCAVTGASRGIAREFEEQRADSAVGDRSQGAVVRTARDGIEDTALEQADTSGIDTPERRDDTGRDSSGSVAVCVNDARVTVERTAREDGGRVVDLSLYGAFGFGRTPALPGEGSGHATGQVPGIGGVTR